MSTTVKLLPTRDVADKSHLPHSQCKELLLSEGYQPAYKTGTTKHSIFLWDPATVKPFIDKYESKWLANRQAKIAAAVQPAAATQQPNNPASAVPTDVLDRLAALDAKLSCMAATLNQILEAFTAPEPDHVPGTTAIVG